MSAATCDVCGHYLHGLDEMCGADHNGYMCECDGRMHYFCACGDRFETVADLTEHGRLCLTIAENEDHLVEGGHLDPSARQTPAPNTGWRRSEPAVIQTPDTRGPWDQRKAEAAAAGLAVAAILAAAGDGTATLAIHCWPAESGTQALREGFPGMDPLTFVDRYFSKAQGITAAEDVTRIEWRYLDGGDDDYLRACECQECGEPVDVTATDCFQCGASLTPTEAGER